MKTVAIAGAGIVGLATALELAGRGMQVTVFERGRVMQEASWAAAGMLAADDPENPAALRDLAQFSLACYPALLSRLKPFGGVHFLTEHTLQVCTPQHVSDGGKVLAAAEAVDRVPGLSLDPGQIPLWLDEQSLDPRALCAALPLAAGAAGIVIHQNTPVVAASQQGDRIAIATPQGMSIVDALVVTTGAWASQGDGGSLHTLPHGSVYPRKGQMLRVRQPEGTQLTTVLRAPSVYIVPRGNGSLIVGATVEDAEFDRGIREDATTWLLAHAAALWTPMASIGRNQIEAVWTGLRPSTADQLPVIGSFQQPRVLFATGHYRNGILLAPGTAKLVASMLMESVPEIDPSPFRPSRLLHQNLWQSAVQAEEMV